MDFPAYMNRDPVRLDELEGRLRQNVEEELRQPDGAWVFLRRHLPVGLSQQFDRELRELRRKHPQANLDDSLSEGFEDYLAGVQSNNFNELAARLIEWSYGEPMTVESLGLLPMGHVNGMLSAMYQIKSPPDDETALRRAREADRTFPDRASSSLTAKLNGVGTGGASDLEETAPLVVSGSALA